MSIEKESQEPFGPNNSFTRQLINASNAHTELEEEIINNGNTDYETAYTHTMDLVDSHKSMAYLRKKLAELDNDHEEVERYEFHLTKYNEITRGAENGDLQPAIDYLQSKTRTLIKNYGKAKTPEILFRLDSLAKAYMGMSQALSEDPLREDYDSF